MTYALNYTNTLQDYTEANRSHSRRGMRRFVVLFSFLFGVWFLSGFLPPAPPAAATPVPVVTAPMTPVDFLIYLAVAILPWLFFVAFIAVVFLRKPKNAIPKPSLFPPKPVPQRTSRMDSIPPFVFLIAAGCALAFYIFIDNYFDLAHRDGSVPARYEAPLRILPWAFIATFFWMSLMRRAIKINWAKITHLQFPQAVTLTDENVTAHNDNFHSVYQWRAFQQWRETPNLFMLYTSGLSFLMIPKRAFASPQEIDAFRTFLHIKTAPPTSAFPVLPTPRA